MIQDYINRLLPHAIKRRVLPINPSPVVILGNQKAGTSAITHLIADYGELTKTVDIPESWWPTLQRLLNGSLSVRSFANQNRHRFHSDVIKEPNLTFFLPELAEIHPEAQFVFVVRHPLSNIRSILDRLSLAGDLEGIDIRNLPETWRHMFDADLWEMNHSHYISLLAERWRKAARVYLSHQERISLIRFEDFLSSKERAIEDLASRLSICQRKDISSRVDVQYQPRGNRDVEWGDFFGRENLGRIRRVCGDIPDSFDYRL